MSPAELPKGSVPGAFFRKVGKPEFAKATPAARYLSWLLLGVGDTSEQALAACGPRFYEGCGLGKRALPSKKGKTHEGLAFFLTRRLLKKAGENF